MELKNLEVTIFDENNDEILYGDNCDCKIFNYLESSIIAIANQEKGMILLKIDDNDISNLK